MSAVALQADQDVLTLHFSSALRMDSHEFFEFCQANPDLRMELTCEGDVIIMPPTGEQVWTAQFYTHWSIWYLDAI